MLFHPALPEASHCHITVPCLQHCVGVPSHTNIHHFICANGRQSHHIIITPMGAHQELETVREECIHASSVLQFNLFGQRNYECRTTIHLFGQRNYECHATIHLFGQRNCECNHSQYHHYFTCPTWQLGKFHEQKVHCQPPPKKN